MGTEDFDELTIPEPAEDDATTTIPEGETRPEVASKAELQTVVDAVAELTKAVKVTNDGYEGILKAIYDAPQGESASSKPIPAPVSTPDASNGDSEVDWNELAQEPAKFAKTLIKQLHGEIDERSARTTADTAAFIASEKKRDALVNDLRVKDVELFDTMKEANLFQIAAAELEAERPGLLRRPPEETIPLVYKRAQEKLEANTIKQVKVLKRIRKAVADTSSERPGPGGPPTRLKREFGSNRETVEAAFEEHRAMFEEAEAAAQAEGTTI